MAHDIFQQLGLPNEAPMTNEKWTDSKPERYVRKIFKSLFSVNVKPFPQQTVRWKAKLSSD